MAIDVVVQDYV